jgi:hypothetical protein
MGGYFALMGQIRIDARLVLVETGEIVGTAGDRDKTDNLFGVLDKLTAKVLDVLNKKVGGAGTRGIEHKVKERKSGEALTVALLGRYAKALEALDKGDMDGARASLKSLLKEHPTFEDAQSTLARLETRGRQHATRGGSVRLGTDSPEQNPASKNFKPYTHSHAVVIGIDNYPMLPTLGGAVRDAKSIAQTLKKKGFSVRTLLDKKATRASITELLGDVIPNELGKNDRLLVYFAGHGMTTGTQGHEMGYLMPFDSDQKRIRSTGVSMRELQNWFAGYPAKHVMFVADACYSGLAVVTRSVGLSPRVRDYIHQITRKRTRATLVAGAMDEQVLEHKGHGLFTYFFLQAIGGAADTNKDGIITTDEIAAYLKPQVTQTARIQYSKSQTPQIAVDGEGEFIFMTQRER